MDKLPDDLRHAARERRHKDFVIEPSAGGTTTVRLPRSGLGPSWLLVLFGVVYCVVILIQAVGDTDGAAEWLILGGRSDCLGRFLERVAHILGPHRDPPIRDSNPQRLAQLPRRQGRYLSPAGWLQRLAFENRRDRDLRWQTNPAVGASSRPKGRALGRRVTRGT
jgi:hypothetical protein